MREAKAVFCMFSGENPALEGGCMQQVLRFCVVFFSRVNPSTGFSFATAKKLSPEIFRNVELDVMRQMEGSKRRPKSEYFVAIIHGHRCFHGPIAVQEGREGTRV